MAEEEITDADVIKEKPSGEETSDQHSASPDEAHKPKASTTDLGEDEIVWGDNDVSEMLDEPTAESSATGTEEEEMEKPSAEEIDAYMKGDLDEEEAELSLEDLRITAELVIELIDALNSTAVGAWVKEPSDTFELSSSKKKTLTGILAKVFYRYQAKLGPVASLIIALLLYFGMTWKMGWDIKKEKEEKADQKRREQKQEKIRKKKEAFRNRILAAIDIEKLTLKEIAKKMGTETKSIKREIKYLCDQGHLFADHSEPIVKYRVAE